MKDWLNTLNPIVRNMRTKPAIEIDWEAGRWHDTQTRISGYIGVWYAKISPKTPNSSKSRSRKVK